LFVFCFFLPHFYRYHIDISINALLELMGHIDRECFQLNSRQNLNKSFYFFRIELKLDVFF